MRTLIMSCNTGAGHNSCAKAIQEVYQERGELCDIVDALQFISPHASRFISNWHTSTVTRRSSSRPAMRTWSSMNRSSARERRSTNT